MLMSRGEMISLLINIGVGIYFFYFYPRSVRKKMGGGRIPPAFALLIRILPPVGIALIVVSLLYALSHFLVTT